MKLASFDALVKALDDASVRYLVAGGLAVNALGLGYRPIVPVQAAQLADRNTREGWIRDKGMQVLQFWSDSHPETPVDVFVAEPFDFDREYRNALVKPLGSVDVRFVSIRALIAMKEAEGPIEEMGELAERLGSVKKT